MKKTIAAGIAVTAIIFGGTTNIIPTTPDHILGFPLYDSSSGVVDLGQYTLTPHGYEAHVPQEQTATTTRPERMQAVDDLTKLGYTEVHQVGMRYHFYDVNNKLLGTSDDQAITTQLVTKD